MHNTQNDSLLSFGRFHPVVHSINKESLYDSAKQSLAAKTDAAHQAFFFTFHFGASHFHANNFA